MSYSQQVNRTSPDRVYTVVHNQDGDSITTGMGVRFLGALDTEEVSANGINAIKIDSDVQFSMMAGIAIQDIASDDYGTIQQWGFVDSIHLSAEADKTIGAEGGIINTYMKKGGVSGTFTSTKAPETLSTSLYKTVQIWNTTNISGGFNYAKGFVRCI